MKRVLLSAVAAAMLASVAAAQTATSRGGASTPVVNRSGAPEDTARIIRAFTQRETQFRKALNEYGFTRDAVIQTLAWGGQISGEYHRTSRFVFDDSGNRFEKILFFPIPTVKAISVTPEDIEDLGGVQAFALEASKINEYDFAYIGKEKIDEVGTYVFDVTPKILSDQKRLDALKKSKSNERYFQGRIWVEDQDYQIVKARGKGVPEFDQRFPTFETYREQIDGKYWFPTYSYADDELTFKNGDSVHVRMRIKYTDFQLLKGKLTIIETDQDKEDDKKQDEKKPAPLPVPPIPKPKP
jgi:opacity protein-like surface antigen